MAVDGKILKICRILQEEPLTTLAAKLGVSPQYLNQIECNKRKPSAAFAERYLEAIGSSKPRTSNDSKNESPKSTE